MSLVVVVWYYYYFSEFFKYNVFKMDKYKLKHHSIVRVGIVETALRMIGIKKQFFACFLHLYSTYS